MNATAIAFGGNLPSNGQSFKECSIFDKNINFMIKRNDMFKQREEYLKK